MSYTTQQHQESLLFGSDETFFVPGGATPAKALKGAFPPDPENNPLLEEAAWLALRGEALQPKHVSKLVTTERDRREFIEGMRLLRLDGERAKPGAHVQPQQLLIADMLAAGHQANGILAPRRVSKSTSPIAVGIGRAAYREDYRVGVFDTRSGKAGRSRFLKDVAPHIERLYPDKRTRPFVVSRIAGMEGLSFTRTGGGIINWLSTLDDIRSEAFDLLLIDESGEPNDPGYVSEIKAAAEPTMDTRPGAQLVYLGTAGRYRKGNLLWEILEIGRNGVGGIVEYSAPDGITDEQLQDWEPTDDNPDGRVRELIEITHPGVGGLTTLDTMRSRFESMNDWEKYAREYLGIFGVIGESVGLIDGAKWATMGSGADLPVPPADFQLVFAAHPDQLLGTVMAVWRDKAGRAHAEILEHKTGVKWIAATAAKIARKFNRPIVYDAGSQVGAVIAEDLTRTRPRPRLVPKAWIEVKKAHALLVDEIERSNITHYRQPELDNAARQVVKRAAGLNGAWALGRGKNLDLDITPLEAFALGLLAYDQAKPLKGSKPSITFSN